MFAKQCSAMRPNVQTISFQRAENVFESIKTGNRRTLLNHVCRTMLSLVKRGTNWLRNQSQKFSLSSCSKSLNNLPDKVNGLKRHL